MHQRFDPAGVNDETCTAERIESPTHAFLENTLASMEAAFNAGAAVVEIDVAKAADDVLVVFHDWTLECRTEASGPIRDMPSDALSTLDVGYGYTSDGETFPFRGLGVGMMPTLEEVFAAFPDDRFLINFKSNDVNEATSLLTLVDRVQAHQQVWAVYGAADSVDTYLEISDGRGFSERTVRACLTEFARQGFPDKPPSVCHNTIVALPLNLAETLPGWPNELPERLAAFGTDLVIVEPDLSGIDTVEEFRGLPEQLEAHIWTDRIEVVGKLN